MGNRRNGISIVAAHVARMVALTAGGLAFVACSGAGPTDSGTVSSSVRANGNESTPIYAYEDAIKESIWVTTTLDDDGDGQPDTVAVDIVRPREAAAEGVKVPVILEASPYYSTVGRGNESQKKTYDANGIISGTPLYYDNYFVPRGYAFVSVDLAGTNRSKGCIDIGGREDILGAKAVIDWLNGRARAARADGTPVVADWTTGKVGMIGKSWDGTIANGVAATGVEGLTTIVPISAISSWYVYTRHNGILVAPEYFDFLANAENGRENGVCDAEFATLTRGEDDATGDFNDFFADRDYLPNVDKVRASVFVVHGAEDWNVTPPQFARWWKGLAQRDVPRKIWLSHEAHVDPFDLRRAEWVETLHRWFDHWLQGRHNGIMDEPMATIERSPNTWVDEPTWPARSSAPETFRLGMGDGATGTIGAGGLSHSIRTFTDDLNLTEPNAVADPNAALGSRLVFLGRALSRDLRISGTPHVDLKIRVNEPTTEVTARLVDYGPATRDQNYLAGKGGIVNLTTKSCWGDSSSVDSACYFDTAHVLKQTDFGVITRGWVDAAHRNSLTHPRALEPSKWYDVNIPFNATDAVIPAGHVLGLVIVGSDNELTNPLTSGATIDVDVSASSVTLPLVQCPQDAVATAVAPAVHAPRAAEPFAAPALDKRALFLSSFQ